MGEHRWKRYGICHGVNLTSFFIPITIPVIDQISTGNELLDLAIRVGISQGVGYIIASIMDWHD
ncbi:MAG: hypothetical protein IIC67_02085 [Thaumarchaeota archaeon]|nr:hypothetical protein [Nitrososphaerota archaeon]